MDSWKRIEYLAQELLYNRDKAIFKAGELEQEAEYQNGRWFMTLGSNLLYPSGWQFYKLLTSGS
jgi:hypothetical protein